MKKLILALTALIGLVGANSFAQPAIIPLQNNTGKLEITYNARTDLNEKGEPNLGATNVFKLLELRVGDRALFSGEIVQTPTIFSSLIGRELQSGKLEYKVGVSAINPSNTAQLKVVGRLTGMVPIDGKGVYHFTSGNLRMGIDATGKAQGFESKFTGKAVGRPPKNNSTLAQTTKKAISIKRSVGGKTMALVVTNYDRMAFKDGMTIAGGPTLGSFPDATVSGEMIYDSERTAWYFQGVTISYPINTPKGVTNITDRLTGNIRYVESPQRKVNGESEYLFDVRVNEPEIKSTEADVFASPDDEGAFFQTDPNLSALGGTMKYKDTMQNDVVTKSEVVINTPGSKLTMAQNMYLNKLIQLVCIVPLNDDE